MKKLKIAKNLTVGLWVYFIIYNTYFGWNILPINEIEELCDSIFRIGYGIAIVIYLLPLLKLYERVVRKMEEK